MFGSKREGSIICPRCGKLVSANSESCYFCGYQKPGEWGLASILKNIFGPQVDLIRLIIYFCAGIYIISLVLDLSTIFDSIDPLRFLSPSNVSVFQLGATGTYAIQYGRWWTPLTAIFLHGGLLHIVFNMLWVRQIGPTVEEFYGTARMVIIFVLSGVIGFIASIIGGHVLTLGASGSIFGLLGALVHYGRASGGSFGETIYRQTATWAVILFISGFIMSGVDNFAHGGGFIGGYLAAMLVNLDAYRSEQRWHRFLAAVCIIATLAAFSFNLFIIFRMLLFNR